MKNFVVNNIFNIVFISLAFIFIFLFYLKVERCPLPSSHEESVIYETPIQGNSICQTKGAPYSKGKDKICVFIKSKSYAECENNINRINYDMLFFQSKEERFLQKNFRIFCGLAENDNKKGCPNNDNKVINLKDSTEEMSSIMEVDFKEASFFKNKPKEMSTKYGKYVPNCVFLAGNLQYPDLIEKTIQTLVKVEKLVNKECKYLIGINEDIRMRISMPDIISKVERECGSFCYFGAITKGRPVDKSWDGYIQTLGFNNYHPSSGGEIFGISTDFIPLFDYIYDNCAYPKLETDGMYLGTILFPFNPHYVQISSREDFFVNKKEKKKESSNDLISFPDDFL